MRLFYCSLLCLFSFFIHAQVTINGKVLDAETLQPLAGAVVAIENTTFRVLTKKDGSFRIFVPKKGKAWRIAWEGEGQLFDLVKEEGIVFLFPKKVSRKTISPWSQRTIEGRVVDGETQQPLGQATVEIVGTTFKTQTDETGHFRIFIPKEGKEFKVTFDNKTRYFPLRKGDFLTLDFVKKGAIKVEKKAIPLSILQKTTASEQLLSKDFNDGHIYYSLPLIQGKVAGVGIARVGDNPNEDYVARIRGVNTFSQRANPLIVVNGVPEQLLLDLDPMDIASIKVLKDAAAAAAYGIRGNSGVIEITTKTGEKDGFYVAYQNYIALEKVAQFWKVGNPAEYLKFGGPMDLGNNTNWQKEVSQTAFSHSHQLVLHGKKNQSTYRLSLNYRDVDGTLKTSGFDNYNARLNLGQTVLNDRLKIQLNAAATQREANLSFVEAFRYAVTSNPTAPVLANGQDDLAGYYQPLRFDVFNPVAILELNQNRSRAQIYSGNISGILKINTQFSIHSLYNKQHQTRNQTALYDENSRFRGEFRNGFASQNRSNYGNDFWSSFLQYQHSFAGINVKGQLGYSYQQLEESLTIVEVEDAANVAFSFDDLENQNGVNALTTKVKNIANPHELAAYFGKLETHWKKRIFLNGSLRYEGSSRLGDNNKWGWFPAVSVGADLAQYIQWQALDYTNMRLGYAITGNPPSLSFLSRQLIGIEDFLTVIVNGEQVPAIGIFGNDNPDLTYERREGWNFGIDFGLSNQRITGSFDVFNNRITDILREERFVSPPGFFEPVWENTGTMKNSGLEWQLQLKILEEKDLQWMAGLNFSRIKTEFVSIGRDGFERTRNFVGAPGGHSLFIHRLENGQAVGNIQGYESNSSTTSGFSDLNRDGFFCHCEEDATIVGNGFPQRMLNLSSFLQYKNFDLNVLFRGVFQHYLVNANRLKYSNVNFVQSGISNIVLPNEADPEDFDFNLLSDEFVEEASFMRLQYLTLGYQFKKMDNAFLKKLRVYIGGQNLLTFSNYTGVDPEVRYEDIGASDNGGFNSNAVPNPIDTGVDRRSSWLPSRVWFLGLKFN